MGVGEGLHLYNNANTQDYSDLTVVIIVVFQIKYQINKDSANGVSLNVVVQLDLITPSVLESLRESSVMSVLTPTAPKTLNLK